MDLPEKTGRQLLKAYMSAAGSCHCEMHTGDFRDCKLCTEDWDLFRTVMASFKGSGDPLEDAFSETWSGLGRLSDALKEETHTLVRGALQVVVTGVEQLQKVLEIARIRKEGQS